MRSISLGKYFWLHRIHRIYCHINLKTKIISITNSLKTKIKIIQIKVGSFHIIYWEKMPSTRRCRFEIIQLKTWVWQIKCLTLFNSIFVLYLLLARWWIVTYFSALLIYFIQYLLIFYLEIWTGSYINSRVWRYYRDMVIREPRTKGSQ